MLESDRRTFQRMKLAKPILATLQGNSALILDIGMGGAFVEHYGAAMIGDKYKLSFRWKGAEIAFSCKVSRTNVIRTGSGDAGADVSHSGLLFDKLSPQAATHLQDMMATFVGKMLAAHRANATAEAPESDAILFQIGQARRSRTRGFARYTLEGKTWTVAHTASPIQPKNGFAVAAYEDEDELETLCRAYERTDEAGRNLIRLVAELSAASARK